MRVFLKVWVVWLGVIAGAMADETLIGLGGDWEYLIYAEGDAQVDPATVDPDFHSTFYAVDFTVRCSLH